MSLKSLQMTKTNIFISNHYKWSSGLVFRLGTPLPAFDSQNYENGQTLCCNYCIVGAFHMHRKDQCFGPIKPLRYPNLGQKKNIFISNFLFNHTCYVQGWLFVPKILKPKTGRTGSSGIKKGGEPVLRSVQLY